MAKDKEQAFATLTLKGANEWTDKGRKDIADWLRRQADNLENLGPQYIKRFRARYLA